MNVEWLILADAAQVVGGKLYLMGGGWDTLQVSGQFPQGRHVGIAASFRVPWNETNQRHGVMVQILSEDGEELAKINAQLEVGRPAGIPAGSDQRAQFAAEMNLQFKSPGTYVLQAQIEGQEPVRSTFRVSGGQPNQRPGGHQ
jgi:hypothetical protein